ncbi:hypothetical protein [Sphingobium sp. YBL2]|jgi:hypothetical protein|nr:hypothetical protein [Sphingobium sp. YBL2]
MGVDAATQQSFYQEVAMFSLLSLYFAYRRDVVVAERYVAGLARAEARPAAPAARRPAERLPLAA